MLRTRRNIFFVTGIMALLFMSSCTVSHITSASKESTSLTPNRIEVHLTTGDIRYLGEVTINIEYKTYLAVIRHIERINGELYDLRKVDRVRFTGPLGLNISPMLSRATYKVTDSYPEADYFVVSKTRTITHRMFLGSVIQEEATVKAYKIGYK